MHQPLNNDVITNNVICYIGGYIVGKVQHCNDVLEDHTPIQDRNNNFIYQKSYTSMEEDGGLHVPSLGLFEVLKQVESSFDESFNSFFIKPKVLHNMKEQILALIQNNLCCTECFQKCIKCYLNMRLHHEAKLLNSELIYSRKRAASSKTQIKLKVLRHQ